MFKFIFGFTFTSPSSLKAEVEDDRPCCPLAYGELAGGKLVELQPLLQLFQRTPFRFRHHAPYKNQLQHHHGCEK